jgi:hypothetical protein
MLKVPVISPSKPAAVPLVIWKLSTPGEKENVVSPGKRIELLFVLL